MTVQDELFLPSQPTVGSVRLQDLHGNGYDSPLFATRFFFDVAGDASGGSIRNLVHLDDNYVHVVNWLGIVAGGNTTGASPARFRLVNPPDGDLVLYEDQLAEATLVSGVACSYSWTPPPMLMVAHETDGSPGGDRGTRVEAWIDNAVGVTNKFAGEIYSWRKDAAFKRPIETFFAPLMRGTSH